MHKSVLVIGAGPAGLAAAITLRQQGFPVRIVDQAFKKQFKAGESLSGGARISLEKLGLWETFEADNHAPCYGNSSAWGAEKLHYYPFLHSLYGHGWHIDRILFETRLREAADKLGVDWLERSKTAELIQSPEGEWIYHTPEHGALATAGFLIDASGRNSWVSRSLGLKRVRDDDQIAVVAFLEALADPVADKSSLVESVEYGWWYTAALPANRMACVLFTDPDVYKNRQLHTPEGWKTALFNTRHTIARLRSGQYELLEPPFQTAAESSRLPEPAGLNRLAAGDAALSFDPLSAHGISLALVSGIDAALAAADYFRGDETGISRYADTLHKAWTQYQIDRAAHYRLENRWPDAPYWQRRNGNRDEQKQT